MKGEFSESNLLKRRLGLLVYQKRTDKKILDSKNKSKLKRDLHEDKNSTERIDDIVHNAINKNLQKAEKALEDFDMALDEGRIEDAIQSLKVANELCHASSDTVENIDENGNKIEEIKGKISENDDKNRKKELNNKLGIGAVYSQDEVLAKDLKNIRDNIKSGIDRNKMIAERNNERVR